LPGLALINMGRRIASPSVFVGVDYAPLSATDFADETFGIPLWRAPTYEPPFGSGDEGRLSVPFFWIPWGTRPRRGFDLAGRFAGESHDQAASVIARLDVPSS